MAENSSRVEVRKLRKKLRQIEHLERLERDLTQEEYEKVSRKSDIRELLKEGLEKLEQDDEVENMSEMMNNKLSVDVENVAGGHRTEEQLVPVDNTSVLHIHNSVSRKNLSAENMQNLKSESENDVPQTTSSSKKSVSPVIMKSISSTSSTVSSAPSTSSMKQAKKQSPGSGSCPWQDKKFTVQYLEGHNDHVFSVDMDGAMLISGSRDTMLKVWDSDTGKEVRSLGGHTGGITSAVLVKKNDYEGESFDGEYLGVTGSRDCSIRIWSLRDGKILRSIYAYSPVLCLDRRKGSLISGSEGGKVELWNLETGENICSTRSDDDSVTCVKFKDKSIVSGSSTGTVKIWDVRQRSLAPALTSDSLSIPFVKKRRVHCLATTENSIYWGDDGTNIKVLDIRAGKVRKLKNHLTEFGSTSAMIVQDSFLISSGYDLDKGTGYLNVRTLPDEEYLATLDDDVTSYISCLCCTDVTKDGVVSQRLCTGGKDLKLWDQMSMNKVRKRTRADQDSSFVTSKHFRRYSTADQIDTESSDESDDERRDDSLDDDDENERATTNARQSWCTIS